MKTEKGDRKLSVNRQSALFLLAGLLAVLVASGYYKLDTAICVQAYGIFAAGIVGKDSAFVWGNAKEHQAAAGLVPATPKPPGTL